MIVCNHKLEITIVNWSPCVCKTALSDQPRNCRGIRSEPGLILGLLGKNGQLQKKSGFVDRLIGKRKKDDCSE